MQSRVIRGGMKGEDNAYFIHNANPSPWYGAFHTDWDCKKYFLSE